MPDDRSASALIREVGLLADGPVRWGRPVRHAASGVFVLELEAPVATPALDLSAIGKWLERVPDLRLDGERPTSKDSAGSMCGSYFHMVLGEGGSVVSLTRPTCGLFLRLVLCR